MKITHNKVGQNLNLVDGVKTDKAQNTKAPKEIGKPSVGALSNNTEAVKVDVSDRALEAKRIKEIAMATPDVDEAKVAKFRKMIDEGTYKIDAKAIADKMVDEQLATQE